MPAPAKIVNCRGVGELVSALLQWIVRFHLLSGI